MACVRLLLDFVTQLKERQQDLLVRLPEDSLLAKQLEEITPSLVLAKAALEKQAWLAEGFSLPLQIAVVGPTQAGKSSLVNLLLGREVAGVSPLAGFTVHPQAFLHVPLLEEGRTPLPWRGIERFFTGFKACKVKDLPKDRYDCFGIEEVVGVTPLPPCVVWDTPDFDSLRAKKYLNAVLLTAALADLLVVVVSKDKYADQSVFDFLALVEELKQPTLVVINKVPSGSTELLRRSFADKWRKVRKDPCPQVLTLEYIDSGRVNAFAEQVFKALLPLCAKARPPHTGAIGLVRRCFREWSAPIRAEIEAQKTLLALTKDALDSALNLYRTDFLDHPVMYETLKKLCLKLLTLLEIPILARPMMVIRRTLTWPFKALSRRLPRGEKEVKELFILQRAIEHALLKLKASIRDQIHLSPLKHLWQEIEVKLTARTPSLLEEFKADSLIYTLAFEPKIEAAALQLYQRLQDSPAALNSLRAARAGTDVAGLSLLFHTGGIGPHDVVLAPAMLSLTSMLTEKALKLYLERVVEELKREQLKEVKALLYRFADKIVQEIQVDPPLSFGISESLLSQVEEELRERPYGLKLF
jgi:GTPase SAR1 family protein